MKTLERWKFYFKNNKYPCFIADTDTDKLLYVNQELLDTFNYDDSILGEKYHEIIPSDVDIFTRKKVSRDLQSIHEQEIFHKETNQSYLVTVIPTEDKHAMFCQLQPVEHGEVQKAFEDAMTRCMDIFQQPTETILPDFMALMGDFYEGAQACVYRFNGGNSTFSSIAEWTSNPEDKIIEEIDAKMNAGFLMEWLQTENEYGVVMADSEAEDYLPNSPLGKTLTTLNLKNTVLCTIEGSKGTIAGVVALHNRTDCSKFFDCRLINTVAHFVAKGVSQDVIDASLFQLHHRDPLTGLYNLAGFNKRVANILDNNPEKVGVVSVSINGLKELDRKLGIEGGDQFVKSTAQRIKEHFNNQFVCEFFRVSADEFVGITPFVGKRIFETKVLEFFQQLRQENNHDFSLGHAWAETVGDNLTDLLDRAHWLSTVNKQAYLATHRSQLNKITDKVLLNLLECLDDDEFMIYLQPQVRLEDGSLYGAEALIRQFDKKNKRAVFPDQFIPLYEEKCVIRHVDMFVVESVCRVLQEWGRVGQAIPISVNLSSVTLTEYGIVDTISAICDKYDIPHDLLVIEVTERVGLIEDKMPSPLITDFQQQGFYISLDDFGCANSNIVTLVQIEVDEVKIDRSLTYDILYSEKNQIIVGNLLNMCNSFQNTKTMAVGIEAEEQVEVLKEFGCNYGQGYLYSRPLDLTKFQEKYIKLD